MKINLFKILDDIDGMRNVWSIIKDSDSMMSYHSRPYPLSLRTKFNHSSMNLGDFDFVLYF